MEDEIYEMDEIYATDDDIEVIEEETITEEPKKSKNVLTNKPAGHLVNTFLDNFRKQRL